MSTGWAGGATLEEQGQRLERSGKRRRFRRETGGWGLPEGKRAQTKRHKDSRCQLDSAAGPPGAVIAPEACQEERRGRGRSEEGAAGAVLVTTLRRLRRRGQSVRER